MTNSERLAALGYELPPVATPVGSYVPAIRVGNEVFTSGQLPMRDGRLAFRGKVGVEVTLADAAEGARLAALNALAAIASVSGGIDQIERIVKLCVYVNSGPGFTEQAKVANGGSDLIGRVFGEAGRHVRSAVGVAELPLDAAVELDVVARVK